MKSLLMLIAVVGLLAVGWMNRDRFLKTPEQADSASEEPAPALSLPSPTTFLGGNAPSTPHPARDAQARATAIYPGIARANSPLNQKFVALYKEAQTSDPALLSRPDWPLELADRAVVSLGGAPMPRTTAASASANGNSRATNAPAARPKKKVVIYTTSHCPYCTQAKRYLTQKGVIYREVNIETSLNGKDEFRKLNGNGVPLIMVESTRIQGFDRQQLDRAL